MLFIKLNIQRFADGEIIIGTKVDGSGMEKDISKLEAKYKNKQLDISLTEKQLQQEQQALEDINKQIEENALKEKEVEAQLEKQRQIISDIKELRKTSGDPTLKREEMLNAYNELDKLHPIYNELLDKSEKLYNNWEKTNASVEKLINKHEKQKTDLALINSEITKMNTANFGSQLKSGFDKLYKSAKNLAFGIIGVRASYSAVKKMASSYLADNEQTANRLANLWTGLGVLMGNIIENIVGMLKKAVTAILYFAQVLTGVNYIAKANEAIIKKQTKATAGLRKEQNKLNASFDEAEVLQSNASSGGAITGGGASVELFDVKELGNAKKVIEELAIKLKPVWEIIKGIVDFSLKHPGAILAILGGIKLIDTISKILGVAGGGAKVGTGLAGILGALTTLATIGAIVITITLAKKILDETKELGKTINNIRKEGQKLHDEFIKSETDINKILDNSNTKRKNSLELLGKQNTYGKLLSGTETEVLKTITDTSKQIGLNIQKEIELYNAGEQNSEVQKSIRDEIFEQYQYNLQVIDALKKRGKDTSEIETLNEQLIQNYKDMGGKIQEANGKMTLLKDNSKVTVEMDLDTKKAQAKSKTFWNTFTEPFKDLFSGISSMFGGTKTKTWTTKANKSAKGAIIYPKLAVGGIINQPGRGVPYGGAIIGERGAEAVVPLTDSQQMALLGEAIGKYITINANIVNTMNGRVISKELQKVQNDSNFAYNR